LAFKTVHHVDSDDDDDKKEVEEDIAPIIDNSKTS
jgi:hypothetical protein